MSCAHPALFLSSTLYQCLSYHKIPRNEIYVQEKRSVNILAEDVLETWSKSCHHYGRVVIYDLVTV
jgi:hypothetical protein